MSFGFSPSDIVALVRLTTKTYQGWKNACGEYADITSMLEGLCVLLQRIRDEADRPGSVLWKDANRQELRDVLRGCRKVVVELQGVITKYKSLSSSRKKNWDRLRFGVKNLSDLRAKLTQHTATITAYLETVGLGSLARIEDRLNTIPTEIQDSIDALAAEIRAGRREGTVMTAYEDDEKEVWRQFRREAVTVDGIKSSTIHKHKPRILEYLRKLAQEGLLEEEEPPDPETERSSNLGARTPVDGSTTDPRPPADQSSATASDDDSAPSSHEDEISEPADTEFPDGWELDVLLLFPAPTLEELRAPRESQQRQGPKDYGSYYVVSMEPSVAEYHELLRPNHDYHSRLLAIHKAQAGEIERYLGWREEHGRQAYLNRQIPWQPFRKPADQMTLTIVLPPLWTYEFRGNGVLDFYDHGRYGKRQKRGLLPRISDPHVPLPFGWNPRLTGDGRRIWVHVKSGTVAHWHPGEIPSFEPGPSNSYDHAWHLGQKDSSADAEPRELISLAVGASSSRWSSRVPPLRSRAPPTEMIRWAFFPEIQGGGWALRNVQRQIAHLEWTPKLEHANPGMREYLIEWQERMDNIANERYETRHLVSHQISISVLNLDGTKNTEGESQRSINASGASTQLEVDRYKLSPANARKSLATDSKNGLRITLFEHTYELGPMRDPIDPIISQTYEVDEADEAIFQLFAAEMLCKLEALLGDPPEATPKDPRNESGSQKVCRIRRLAFACYFADAANVHNSELWDAVATLTRNLYGGVTHQPGRRGFLMWLDLLHPPWSRYALVHRWYYRLARSRASAQSSDSRVVQSGFGSVYRYLA